MSTPTISLCMIVKDEEAHLQKCFQSVQAIVDEIIVVDTGSTDASIAIAEQYGAKVYSFSWIHDFSAARNYALEQATSDFILVLDADEYLEPGVKFDSDLADDQDCYTLTIKNLLDSNTHFHHAIRLFKNRIGLRYQGRIHEHLNIGEFAGLKMKHARPLIIHTGYTSQVYQKRNKHERNFQLLEQAVQENPSGYNYYNLAKQYMSNQQYDKALTTYKQAFALSKDRVYLTHLLSNMAECLLRLKRYPEGIQLAQDAIDSFPGHTVLYFRLGELYKEYGYLEDAITVFQKCVELGEVEETERLAGVGSFLAHTRLGEIYLLQGKRLEAMEAAFYAIQEDKGCQEAIVLYLQVMSQTKVPIDTVYENMLQIFSLKTGQEVLALVRILFFLRHPLLDRLLTDFHLPNHQGLQMFAKQYSRQYEDARQLWLTQESIEPDKAIDLLLLAVYLQDEDLFARCKPLLNVSQKEWKTLHKVVKREDVNETGLTDSISKILLELCTKALIMEEFEAFESLSAWVMRGSVRHSLQLADTLTAYGYLETAVDLLLQLQHREPKKADVYQQLGDILFKTNQLPEALHLYVRLLDSRPDFASFSRMYQIYKKMDDVVGLRKILLEMRDRFPLSQWVETQCKSL